jgi:hypothetical protein
MWSASISLNAHILVLLALLPIAQSGQLEVPFFSASAF